MVALALTMVAYLRAFFVPRQELALEAAALLQQFVVFKRKPLRPILRRLDRLFYCSRRYLPVARRF